MLKSEIRRLIQTRLIQILLYKQDLTEPKEDRGEKNEDQEDEASDIKKKNEIKETKKGEGFKKRMVSNINYYRI